MEEIPWADGKHPVTQAYAWFLAKRLSWKGVVEVFQSSGQVVFGAVLRAVAYGREPLDRSGMPSLGIACGVVEGFNAKAKLTTKTYGFRTYHGLEIGLYHTLGALPEPKFTHKLS
ncbi:MAG: hypothetical protein ACREXX_13625 [Gammaproteobacteria bacterium]